MARAAWKGAGRLSLAATLLLIAACGAWKGTGTGEEEGSAGIEAAGTHWVVQPVGTGIPPPGSDIAYAAAQKANAAAAEFSFKPMEFLQRPDGMAYYESLAIADFDGDGRDDVIAYPGTSAVDLWRQTPAGRLALRTFTYEESAYSHAPEIAIGDFNEDGLVDAAVSTVSPQGARGGVHLFSFSPNAGFRFLQVFPFNDDPTRSDAQSWTVLDADADGHLDIIGTLNIRDDTHDECGTGTCSRLKIMYGDGRGLFDRSEEVVLGFAENVAELEAEDLNSDGAKDLVMVLVKTDFAHQDDRAEVKVAYRKTAGGFAPLKRIHDGYVGNGGGNVVFADLNSDGEKDSITFTCGYPQVRYKKLNDAFEPALYLYSLSSYPCTGLVADLDGDRRADVMTMQILGLDETGMGVYLQKTGSLQSPWYYNLSGREVYYGGLPRNVFAAGDLNGDGCRDAAAVTSSNNGILVMKGQNCQRSYPSRLDEADYRWKQ